MKKWDSNFNPFEEGEVVTLPTNVRVSSVNIRTKKGNRAKSDKVLPKGHKLTIQSFFTSTGMGTHGTYCAKAYDDNYKYSIPVENLRGRIYAGAFLYHLISNKELNVFQRENGEYVKIIPYDSNQTHDELVSYCEEVWEQHVKEKFKATQ